MKHYAKPTTALEPAKAALLPTDGQSLTSDAPEFDVVKQLSNAQQILQREIRNLMSESSTGKLSPTSARDLVQYIKLLSELKADEEAQLANMTDEELSAIKQT